MLAKERKDWKRRAIKCETALNRARWMVAQRQVDDDVLAVLAELVEPAKRELATMRAKAEGFTVRFEGAAR